MGKSSTLQTFSDTNQEVAPVPYEKASGGAEAKADGPGGIVRVPVVKNVKGSAAGVGSSFFHSYRMHRREEQDRIKDMDVRAAIMTKEQEHLARMELNKLESDERTLKRAAKRNKRKEKERSKRRRGDDDKDVSGALETGADGTDDEEGEGDELAEVSAEAAAALDGSDDELLKNDGKFLERAAALTAAGHAKDAEKDATATAAIKEAPHT